MFFIKKYLYKNCYLMKNFYRRSFNDYEFVSIRNFNLFDSSFFFDLLPEVIYQIMSLKIIRI